MLLILAITIVIGAGGTLYGVLAPPIAAMLGYSIGLLLHCSASDVALLCIGGYLASFFASSILEVGGRTADVQMALLGQDALPRLTRELATGYLRDRVVILILFIILPIGAPAGHLTGLAAGLLTGALAIASTRRQTTPQLWLYLTIQYLLVHAATLLATRLIGAEPAIGIIIATALPSLLLGEAQPDPEDPHQDSGTHYLDPMRLLISGLLTWITPGYSATAATSVFATGTERWLSSGLVNCAIEGWVVHTFLTGKTSGKSVLGDVLITQASLGSTPMPNLFVPIICTAIACAVIAIALTAFIAPQEYSPLLLTIPLITQGVLLYGINLALFLVLGLVLYQARQWLRVPREATLVGIVGLS